MLINKNSTEPNIDLTRLFADGIVYINTSQWVFAHAAFSYLYQNSKSKSVTLLYNMALCHYFAKEYAKAISVLTAALTQVTAPSISSQSNQNVSNELFIHEFENNLYQLALNETTVELSTNIVKLRIRRLMVDLHLVQENWQEVIRLSTLPEMDKCKNVQEALIVAKSKVNTL
ncbi:hypothetical protein [Pedobacter xixiisoli]|uniref:Tetratricopeptide repeat-containing protein n=1 Tax=Pedobacter xixiisoli TaxID=1476464 RepID=A0A285ZQ11_9SPHI|nr:hypothetical protein [Pedobacter xixiisoli]SOD11729.1 hypothetical protein SAMN06297358_0304 [Pedobacter xixiisoli]